MARIRRKLFHTYANLDLPIQWQDEQVAAYMEEKGVKTRRQAMAYVGNMYAAFASNSNLRWFPELKWFAGMPKLLRYAFRYCPNLEEIELPPNITCIGQQCFDGDKKLGPDFVIPPKVAQIDWYAFHDCTGIKNFKVLNPTPPTVESIASVFSSDTAEFYVPDDAVETYKAASGWSAYASRIHPMSECPSE